MGILVKFLGFVAAMVVAANTVVVCDAAESTEDPTLDPELAEREEGFRQLTEDITRFATKQFYPIISELIYDPRLSSKCAGGLLKIGTAMRDGELWALQSKFPVVFFPISLALRPLSSLTMHS